ncbi:hypothetical protein G7078_00345 [Sphingomonas sinipercae]|uniref:Uncharacterized protein n=1 Tax=Sphingomonas sinipercae TaxID=2714944 RepID=A0A6G7ZK91_9SPHN|nr:hypothetical protein [Sphingomonas sinipercae]QIL01394.1 hypothetical protein G7078_00345 [Sphingomonas sinipercae]
MKKQLFVIAALFVAAVPALAQVVPVKILRPVAPGVQVRQIQQAPGYNPVLVDPANDPDRARALIAKLQKDKRAMREKMQTTLLELQNARTTIDEMTRVGGSLVRAQCVSSTLSRTTSGVEENCAASGYMCAGTEGTCHRSCTTSSQCAAGFVCDTGASRCVTPPPPADDSCDSFWDFC